MSLIKSAEDIKALRVGGKMLAEVLEYAKTLCVPGAVLLDIDAAIDAAIREKGAKPSFLGYEGFPNAACLSLNSEVVHGIPDRRVLKEGDIIGVDAGLWWDGRCVDGAVTVPVGDVSPDAKRLLQETERILYVGIAAAKPFRRVGAISQAVQDAADTAGLGIVRALTGHGVGHHVHEDPSVPNYGRASDGILLRPGMVIAIEPMLNLGNGDVFTEIDGWTVTTTDGSLSAQFEHTVLITQKGAEILTKI
jgi:methionyl aminopeptidase